MAVTIKLHTVVLIKRDDKVLLVNRVADPIIQGYIPPGGKVDFPESLTACAIREVQEETGLTVTNLVYKGLHQFVNQAKAERYMIFNYLAEGAEGDLLESPPEGALEWVPIADVPSLPLNNSFRRRFPLFFEPGTFEMHTEWDENGFTERVTRL